MLFFNGRRLRIIRDSATIEAGLTKIQFLENLSVKLHMAMTNYEQKKSINYIIYNNFLTAKVGTDSIQYLTVPSAGLQDIGFKKPTVVGYKNPTRPTFRVGWQAPLIRVYTLSLQKIKSSPINSCFSIVDVQSLDSRNSRLV